MKTEIKVPSVGESVVEATVGTILKASGSQVRADEEILELETDKVNQIVYAPANGELELLVKTGDVVNIQQVIGYVDTEKTASHVPKKEESVPQSPPTQKADIPPAKPETTESSESTSRETRKKMSKLRSLIAQKLVAIKKPNGDAHYV